MYNVKIATSMRKKYFPNIFFLKMALSSKDLPRWKANAFLPDDSRVIIAENKSFLQL